MITTILNNRVRDYDIARYIKSKLGDVYIYKRKNIWYKLENEKWVEDKGAQTLLKIINEESQLEVEEILKKIDNLDIKRSCELFIKKCRKIGGKNNILKELQILYKKDEIEENLDIKSEENEIEITYEEIEIYKNKINNILDSENEIFKYVGENKNEFNDKEVILNIIDCKNLIKKIIKPLKTKYNIDSYRGKHVIEEYRKYKLKREGNIYISKEEFIIAMILNGYNKYKIKSSNCIFLGQIRECLKE